MSLELVQKGLVDKFLTAFSSWNPSRIAWENLTFTTPPTDPWMAFHFMPAAESVATLGPHGLDENLGLVQIDLNIPNAIGEGTSRQTIDLLRTCFTPGTFQYGGQAITILNRNRRHGQKEDGFYKIPFLINWRAFLPRS